MKATVGLKNLYYAKLLKDDSTGINYDTPKRGPALIEINYETNTNETTLYADDMPLDVATSQGETSFSMNSADLPLEMQADLLGHKLINGVLVCSADDVAPYFAVMFENQQRDGSTRYVKLLKGKFKEPSDNSKTKTDSPEFSTPTIEATFINRAHDKLWKKVAVSSNPDFTGADKWYISVEESAGGGN